MHWFLIWMWLRSWYLMISHLVGCVCGHVFVVMCSWSCVRGHVCVAMCACFFVHGHLCVLRPATAFTLIFRQDMSTILSECCTWEKAWSKCSARYHASNSRFGPSLSSTFHFRCFFTTTCTSLHTFSYVFYTIWSFTTSIGFWLGRFLIGVQTQWFPAKSRCFKSKRGVEITWRCFNRTLASQQRGIDLTLAWR